MLKTMTRASAKGTWRHLRRYEIQHNFVKGKLCLTNLIEVAAGKSAVIVYTDFYELFHKVTEHKAKLNSIE